MRQIKKFISLSNDEKALLIEAIFFLFYSKLLLLLPFKYCVSHLKNAERLEDTEDIALLRKIHDAIARANKLAFWKNICLVKSVAARFMFQRRNILSVMYLGLQFRNGEKLIAHAWLISGGITITPKGRTAFKEIYSI